jgi:hypothetical protein
MHFSFGWRRAVPRESVVRTIDGFGDRPLLPPGHRVFGLEAAQMVSQLIGGLADGGVFQSSSQLLGRIQRLDSGGQFRR